MIEIAGPVQILFAARARVVPVRFARHRGEALREARGDRRRAAELRGACQNDVGRAEQLREVVCRQPDAPFGEIEPELEPHRPREPWIAARLRRPDAFDQCAQYHAVDVDEARFEKSEDLHARAGPPGAAARTVGKRNLEQLGVIAGLDAQAAGLRGDVLERKREFHAVGAGERRLNTGIVLRQRAECCGMQGRDCGEGLGARAFKWRERCAKRRGQFLRGIEIFGRKRLAWVGPVQRALRGAECLERVREPGAARARAGGHAHRDLSGDSPCVRAAAAPSRKRLRQREQRHRFQTFQRRRGHEPREHAGLGIREGIAAGIIRLDVPAPECGRHAARERTIRGHQRNPRFFLFQFFSQRDRDGERLFLGIRGFDDGDVFQRGVARGLIDARRPAFGRARWPHGFRYELRARTSVRKPRHLVARDADAAQQRVHGKLRMARRRRLEDAVAVHGAADQRPCGVVQISIEAGQHHGALRQARDGGEQFGGRRHRAGRTRGDHRAVVRGEPHAFRLDQQIAPRRRIEPAFLRKLRRPIVSGDLEEAERELPVFVETVGHQRVQPLPRHLARRHVVDQPREIVRERECGGRRVHDQRRFARFRREPLGPFEHQLRQQHPPLQTAQRLGQFQRGRAARRIGEGQLVLVDVAERDDTRQHGGIDPEYIEEGLAR